MEKNQSAVGFPRYRFHWIAMCFALLSVLAISNIAVSSTAKILTYTAPLGERSQPSLTRLDHFQCSEQIFTVLEVVDFQPGRYELTVKWIDPSGEVREQTRYTFAVGKTGSTKLWAWLELSRASGAAMIAWLNPAAGLEEFVGTWDVEVKINNRLVSTLDFDVTC